MPPVPLTSRFMLSVNIFPHSLLVRHPSVLRQRPYVQDDFSNECFALVIAMLLPASAAYQHFSSSMAREMIRYGQPLEQYLPASIIPLVRDLIEKKEG